MARLILIYAQTMSHRYIYYPCIALVEQNKIPTHFVSYSSTAKATRFNTSLQATSLKHTVKVSLRYPAVPHYCCFMVEPRYQPDSPDQTHNRFSEDKIVSNVWSQGRFRSEDYPFEDTSLFEDDPTPVVDDHPNVPSLY